jgi:hypothetical protein
MKAAKFVGARLQCSPAECSGRAPDMSSAQGEQMRQALGQIEAACKLMSNMDTVVKDITNKASSGVYESEKSQPELARVDPNQAKVVQEMLKEVCNRLFGSAPRDAPEQQMRVWVAAARFFGQRVQDPEDNTHPHRAADMSAHAARQLRAVLARMEAACELSTNLQRVSQDITNSNPKTQLDLKRVSVQNKPVVENMLQAVVAQLRGSSIAAPSISHAAVWVDAAVYLSGRIQSEEDDCPGRAPDMSLIAGMMMRKTLAGIEASCRLTCNREKVVQDITNPDPETQKKLARVQRTHQASVDQMVREVCGRLLGSKSKEPESDKQAQVWRDAASYLNGRIQSSASQCRGREADMTPAAASAMRAVLSQIDSKTDAIEASKHQVATRLMCNRDRVVKDICNPGAKNIDGQALTQPDLKRLGRENEASVHAMISDVCCSLTHTGNPRPATAQDKPVWQQAAVYLSARVQGSPEQKPGRNPDMSVDAAQALKAALAHV